MNKGALLWSRCVKKMDIILNPACDLVLLKTTEKNQDGIGLAYRHGANYCRTIF